MNTTKRTNRVAQFWVAAMAVAILAGIGALGIRLRPYWVAKYRGLGADLHGASLPGAQLVGAELGVANLRRADLRHADLRGANLSYTLIERRPLAGGAEQ